METYLASKFPSLERALKSVLPRLQKDDNKPIALINQQRVLEAFAEQRVGSHDLLGTTGYGYNDQGRDKLEDIYARVFGGEAALVRPQISSGTHALWLALSGNSQPGDEIISVTGKPYQTLESVLSSTLPGSFKSLGIKFSEIDLQADGQFNLPALKQKISTNTKIIYVQRSRGYSLRPPVGVEQIDRLIQWLQSNFQAPPPVVVDNCYGEFVQSQEPGHVGAGLTVGSLIKNPGGGLAETGGYLVGDKELVENAGNRLLAPGLEGEVGATGNYLHSMFQGLFLAPHSVGQSVYNARFAAALGQQMGFQTWPRWDEPRYDIVQAIQLDSEEVMLRFCRQIQAHSPIDSFVSPVAGEVPGYNEPVVMAAGTFIQGASLELSVDGPMQHPYIAYLQGGLSKEHGMLAICAAFAEVL